MYKCIRKMLNRRWQKHWFSCRLVDSCDVSQIPYFHLSFIFKHSSLLLFEHLSVTPVAFEQMEFVCFSVCILQAGLKIQHLSPALMAS